MSLIGR